MLSGDSTQGLVRRNVSKHETRINSAYHATIQRIELEQSERQDIEEIQNKIGRQHCAHEGTHKSHLSQKVVHLVRVGREQTRKRRGSTPQLPVRHSRQGRKRNRTTRGQSKNENEIKETRKGTGKMEHVVFISHRL
jgi:hypothetical protein